MRQEQLQQETFFHDAQQRRVPLTTTAIPFKVRSIQGYIRNADDVDSVYLFPKGQTQALTYITLGPGASLRWDYPLQVEWWALTSANTATLEVFEIKAK